MTMQAFETEQPPPKPARSVYGFGPFRFETAPNRLLRGSEEVAITPQAAQLLDLFLSRAGEVVSREEIRRHLWGSETHVDFDPAINVLVRQLRRRLGDSASSPRYLETLPRSGYRFVGPLHGEAGPAAAVRGRGLRLPSPAPALWTLLAALALLLVAQRALQRLPQGTASAALDLGESEIPEAARRWLEKGRDLALDRRTDAAIEALRRASELAPSSAATWSELALAYLDLKWDNRPLETVLRSAEAAARRALELDPGRTDAHFALADVAFRFRFDFDAAQLHYQAALAGDPANPDIHHHYGLFCLAAGRQAEAVEHLQRARALGTDSGTLESDLAYAFFLAGDGEAALHQARRGARAWPTAFYQNVMLVDVLSGTDPQQALIAGNEYRSRTGGPRAEDLESWYRQHRDIVAELVDAGYPLGTELARLEARVGDVGRAVELLAQACRRRSGWGLLNVRRDPRYAPLREHPGFAAVEVCLDRPLRGRPFAFPPASASGGEPDPGAALAARR